VITPLPFASDEKWLNYETGCGEDDGNENDEPTQHAIIGMTKSAAIEQGVRGIRVNAAAPGPIAGGMTFKLADEVFAGSDKTFAETVLLGRHGTPEDLAGLLLLAVRRLELRDRHDALGRCSLHDSLVAHRAGSPRSYLDSPLVPMLDPKETEL
jgi:hypothetical protein